MEPSKRIASVQNYRALHDRIEAIVRAHWWADDDPSTNPGDPVPTVNLAWAVGVDADVQAAIEAQEAVDGGTNAVAIALDQLDDDTLRRILLNPSTGALARLTGA